MIVLIIDTRQTRVKTVFNHFWGLGFRDCWLACLRLEEEEEEAPEEPQRATGASHDPCSGSGSGV